MYQHPLKIPFALLVVLLLLGCESGTISSKKRFKNFEFGDVIDTFNSVNVYYNGSMSTVKGRNVTPDGYNLGLKYQCVEFVKRYYYEAFNHKMPNSYGHAKDFFQAGLKDGAKNNDRNLTQFTNPSKSKPQVHDLIVFKGTTFNKYGHVAIVSKVSDKEIEIIQQNVGTSTRNTFKLKHTNNKWEVQEGRVVGWLRR